ncbi:PEP-CTERM sorting domain-containing protein [Aliiglaciecola sp. LCG003]|uniref:PEP-CTERM sorting domain-containing protein n=1 Tax=Aliiglaciecola sp. LCG003 TaxID=3053655 RepID=UPI0025730BE5|nr:PEP-CTERM sorting domain-containing protein [Aliiglaciecola sp. LCG003]WJG10278.1 PEP-CTERM sorting domain-containing protein [Aliiglaciecola sp. LCG003]
MEQIQVNKIDGTAFDLNYFKITTNTDCGGCAASGSEEVYLNALMDGTNISFTMLLPSDDWGFAGPNSELFLGAEFDGIMAFSITYGSGAEGFGMDEFFIDEEPPSIPEPATLALLALGIMGVGLNRRNRKTIIG